jgi:hypothetical protein
VCIHPAYRPWLTDNASVLNRLMAPLLGISGAPTRAEQRPLDGPVIVGSTLVFPPVSDPFHTAYVVNAIALALVRNSPPHDALPQACLAETTMQSCIATLWAAVQDCQDAQNALASWLVTQSGLGLPVIGIDQGAKEAAQRFGTLGATQQHAWLQTHYLAVRQCQVPLEQLP